MINEIALFIGLSLGNIILLIFMTFLLLLIFFFSITENAIIAFNRLKLEYLLEKKHAKAKIIDDFLKSPDEFLSGVLIGNTIAHTVAPILAAAVAVSIWHHAGFTIASVVMTLTILIFCEIIPKVLASQFTEPAAYRVAKPMKVLLILLSPLIAFTTLLTDVIFGLFGVKIKHRFAHLTKEEIKHVVKMSGQEGYIKPEEAEFLRAAFEFHDKKIKDVMIPREKIVALNINSPQHEVLKFASRKGFTRIPVYKDNIDNIVAILYSKDLLNTLLYKNIIIFQDLLREPFFVNQEEKISDVLRKFQKNRLHLAVVKNKGKTVGIVTLEDILEEIVGEIYDEFH